jgi:hypothetical protein
MATTLTSANASVSMTASALFPQPVAVNGFAADDAFEPEAIENGEYSYGIDGTFSAGFVFNEVPLVLTIQANSPSIVTFEQIWNYEFSNRTKQIIGMTISVPSIARRYQFTNGYLRSYKAPAGKRILQPAVVNFVFGQMAISST